MPAIVCPQCNKDDAIQKISAIVDAGKSSGSYSGPSTSHINVNGKSGTSYGYSYLTGSSMTELAKTLSAPLEPTKPRGWGILRWIAGWFAIAIISGMSSWLILEIFSYFIFKGNAKLITDNLGSPTSSFLGIALFLIFGWLLFKLCKTSEKKEFMKQELEYFPEKAKWDSAMQRWRRLYYCHRNGIVFDPETNETYEPANIKTFIYQQFQP